MLVGPRAAGKTTTARRRAGSVLRLDRPAEAGVAAADPDLALEVGPEPVLIDEWQLVPEIIGAVKRAVDEDSRPGRFLLTGSAGTDLGPEGWPATGRVVRVPFWGLCQRELVGNVEATAFLDRVKDGEGWELPGDVPDLRGYVRLALRSGFPDVVFRDSDRLRQAWLATYVDQLATRDAAMLGAVRDPVRLRSYLMALAANTAGVVEHKTVYDAAGVTRETALAYDALLVSLFVVELLPAWASNRLSRLTATPKRHLVDPALMGPLLGVDERAVWRDVDLLGRVVESFVVAQLRAERAVCRSAPRLFHLRQKNGRHEVDLLAEFPDGRVIAMEIKAHAAPDRAMATHLLWLQEELGDRFIAGLVFHTGPRAFPLAEGIHALPICAIWG